jgi:hypothetical protein
MDWKSIIKNTAPVLGSALGGPLGGVAASFISNALTGESLTQEALSDVINKGLSSDEVLSLKRAEQEFTLEILRLNSDQNKAYLADTQNARAMYINSDATQKKRTFILGIILLAIFFSMMLLQIVWGYKLITEGVAIRDPAMIGFISSTLGNVSGYVAAYAQQVVGFFFGSSSGSETKNEMLKSVIH